jgi:CheY-like chemotaxis protein
MHALGLFIGELQAVVSTQEQRKVVLKIEESVHAMTGLLNSLLDISRLDAGVIVPQPVDFNIETILNRVEQNYRSVANSKSLSFRITHNQSLIHSDPILLERIIVNLVSNALRYTPVKGSVMVVCRKRKENLLIEIRDNGIGIPPEEQKNIFHEFVQLANKERDRSMGLGLGLAIVERLSRLMDHPISLRSASGRGSVFTVVVPLATNQIQTTLSAIETETAIENPDVASASEISAGQILVVDDDPLVRSGTEGILSAWGYQVSVASCLDEIRSKFPGKEFDLVLCDYRLPDGTGLEVGGYISQSGQSMPPCILVSGDTSPDILQSVTESGFHFLSKPVRPAKLRSLIQFLLEDARKNHN